MTDMEMTKLCAEAMGTPPWVVGDQYPDSEWFWPLRHDAQAMALVKKLGLYISCYKKNGTLVWQVSDDDLVWTEAQPDLNRAIVECATGSTKPSNLSTSTPEGIPESP
jgi:hypothetical protein